MRKTLLRAKKPHVDETRILGTKAGDNCEVVFI